MAGMTGPDCAVMCNLINIHTHTHTGVLFHGIGVYYFGLFNTVRIFRPEVNAYCFFVKLIDDHLNL